MRLKSRALAAATALLLSACVSRQPPTVPAPAPAPVPPPPTALQLGLTAGQPVLVDEAIAERALAAFQTSCPALLKRTDKTLLTTPLDWQPLCAAAATVQPGAAAAFFRDNFEWDRMGPGKAFATGYYEPEIAGSRTPMPGYAVPVYRTPPDLVRCVRPDGTNGRGRIDPATSQCVPYYSRPEIEDGALANKGLELGWAADPVDLFFVEIQGSGRLVDASGNVVRIGYDNQNGQNYVAIGKLLRDRGILPPGGANMEAIKAWIRANPDQGRALMRENLSYIFFRELTGPGPIGAMGVPVTPRASVAADPLYTPLGAPLFVESDRPEINGLWVAQDVGGAIKGANRFDTFWGAGPDATRIAGGMSANGRALLLLPKGTAARALAARDAQTAAGAQAQP